MGLERDEKVKRWVLSIVCCLGTVAYAQPSASFLKRCVWYGLDDRRGKLDVGLEAGAGVSQIEAIRSTLTSGDRRADYEWDSRLCVVPSVNMQMVYKRGYWGFDAGVCYSMQRFRTEKQYALYAETYGVNYHYAGVQACVRVWLYKGWYCGIGASAAWCLNKDGVWYDSHRFASYEQGVYQIQNRLREVMAAKADVGPVIKTGYEFASGLTINVSYRYGCTDIIAVTGNDYDYNEENNDCHRFVLSLGYQINLFDYETGRREPGWKKWVRE